MHCAALTVTIQFYYISHGSTVNRNTPGDLVFKAKAKNGKGNYGGRNSATHQRSTGFCLCQSVLDTVPIALHYGLVPG